MRLFHAVRTAVGVFSAGGRRGFAGDRFRGVAGQVAGSAHSAWNCGMWKERSEIPAFRFPFCVP